ncbi:MULTISPECIES: hypothetical protein [unclassified Yoonia]|uniref:hypothetical protein n=1 Tax=unclassified Yoonia TaxID=2629118 RepID=UPI002AFF3C9B|nr:MULTISPECIES: hypothetical protein [unclassified Yoonia]
MKTLYIAMPVAAIGLLMGSVAAFAQETTETQSFTASVQGALQGDTGFLTGGQAQVNGVGQASVVLSRGDASITVLSGAQAGVSDGIPESGSSMVTTFDFNRDVNTAAALVGVGNVIAQGESLGGTGVVGTASADASRAGTANNAGVLSSGSASSETSAQGSLVGQFQTMNTIQLLGQGSLFAGAQALDIGENNAGVSFGSTGLVSAGDDGVDLTATSIEDFTDGGAGFLSTSTLTNETIDLNVSSAGQGSVLVTASTGGFFGQGTTFGATATPSLSQVGGFFTTPVPLP